MHPPVAHLWRIIAVVGMQIETHRWLRVRRC
jgi:hypothetical protein